MVHPIIDEYYNYNPYHLRSSKFVQDKGLVTNEKGSKASTPSTLSPNKFPPKPTSLLHETFANSLIPSMLDCSVSPALSPAPEYRPASKEFHSNVITPMSARDPNRPQEMGNIKKKRKELEIVPDSPEQPPQRTFGDPNKIAQYFPELN